MYNTNEIMTGDINNILMSGCRMDWPEMTEAHNPDVCIVFNEWSAISIMLIA